MPKEFSRMQRVSDVLQHALAPLLQQEFPELINQMVTISSIKVSKDMSHAKVHITLLEENEEIIAEILAKLNEKASILRHALARQVNLRKTPRLHFVYDKAAQYSSHLASVISAAS